MDIFAWINSTFRKRKRLEIERRESKPPLMGCMWCKGWIVQSDLCNCNCGALWCESKKEKKQSLLWPLGNKWYAKEKFGRWPVSGGLFKDMHAWWIFVGCFGEMQFNHPWKRREWGCAAAIVGNFVDKFSELFVRDRD